MTGRSTDHHGPGPQLERLLRKEAGIPISHLLLNYRYDPSSGKLLSNNAKCLYRVGKEVGKVQRSGYRCVALCIADKRYQVAVHRVVWAIYHRAWPNGLIDHIDRDKLNNRISNFRVVTAKENNANRRDPRRAPENMTVREGRLISKTEAAWRDCASVGMTQAEAARYLGCAPVTANAASRRYGITFRLHERAPYSGSASARSKKSNSQTCRQHGAARP